MGSKSFLLFVFLILLGFSRADMDKDREECGNQLVGLATCLPYVGGDAKNPTPDCCSGLKEVLDKSKKCLCVLVKDRNDPSLGLKINATLALGLPTICRAPANISACPDLLHLAPNSPDAKVFQDFVNSGKGSSSAPAAPESGGSNGKATTAATEKSDGGQRRTWMGFHEMIMGLLVITILSYLT